MSHSTIRIMKAASAVLALGLASVSGAQTGAAAPKGIVVIPPGSAYKQANLISDVPGVAFVQDAQLINPWGIVFRGTSPFWVANNGFSAAGVYQEAFGGNTMVINPAPAAISIPGGLPTGAVANPTTDFEVAAARPSAYLFASITGNIVGWHPSVPAPGSTTGTLRASHPGHVLTGLAIGNNGANVLYAADFFNDHIDIYSATFVKSVGTFVDATIPKTVGNRFNVHNIQNLGGSLYVTYAKVGVDGGPEYGVGNGFVRRFNTSGVRDLTFGINNGPLNAPWGVAIAPASFGIFGGALLVGNSSVGGRIHAFNPTTGAFLGTLQDEGGVAIQIDQLWGLSFGNDQNAGDAAALYFTAGIGDESHGLLGSLRPTTATATALLEFSASSYSVSEALGFINITVLRSGDVGGAASVNYAGHTQGPPNNASANDYVLPPGTVTFTAGETSKSFTVTVVKDKVVELNESLTLVLSNATGAGLASRQAELTITDPGIFIDGFEN